jgi:SAM-dependent methyltransferase
MIKYLFKLYNRIQFNPGFFGIFFNPFFFIRRRLYSAIKEKSSLLSGVILDLGCGSKPYIHLFTKSSQYIGVDIENPGHDHSKEDVDVYYDGKKLPFANEHFDNAFFSEVLEHIFEPEETLAEVHRVLKKDGLLLLTVPFAWDEHEIPNDYGRYTSFGVKHLLHKCNFEIVEIEKTGHFFEVIVQYFTHYLRHLLFTRNKYVNLFINLVFIAPFTIIGFILVCIMPRIKTLYFNNIIIAKRK